MKKLILAILLVLPAVSEDQQLIRIEETDALKHENVTLRLLLIEQQYQTLLTERKTLETAIYAKAGKDPAQYTLDVANRRLVPAAPTAPKK
jgi:hypothetical protein